MALRTIKRTFFALLIFLLGFSLISCNNETTNNNNNENPEPPNNVVRETEKIDIIYNLLNNHYYGHLDIDIEKINTVEELLSHTDPYTNIYKVGSTNIEKGETYPGLGIIVSDVPEGLLVTDVNDSIELYKRLFSGDVITKINNVDLSALTFEEKNEHLRKELNEEITFSVTRLDNEITLNVRVVEIPFPSVISNKYDDIGYLQITRFARTTYNTFKELLFELEEDNIKGLIIDVRNNGGGYLNAVLEILRIFLVGDDPMFYLYSPKKDEYTPYYPSSKTTIIKPYPIYILTNQNSASASEVLAASMQKFGYTIIGEKTYGKDVFQSHYSLDKPFEDNLVLNMTSGYWLIDKTNSVSGGLYPDIFIYEKGVNSLLYPVLKKEYQLGEISPYIGVYQYLISLTTPGDFILNYFSLDFKDMLKEYQEENDLTVTGILDLETQKHLIIYYKELKKEKIEDNILTEALKEMEKEIAGN